MVPPTALAADRIAGFDGFAAGTTITNQVSGLTFPEGPEVFEPGVADPFSTPTASPFNALRTPNPCIEPCRSYRMTVVFDRPAKNVSVRIGEDAGRHCNQGDDRCAQARMVGLDARGTIVADSLNTGPRPPVLGLTWPKPITTPLAMSASAHAIKTARIYFGQEDDLPNAEPLPQPVRVQIDDLR